MNVFPGNQMVLRLVVVTHIFLSPALYHSRILSLNKHYCQVLCSPDAPHPEGTQALLKEVTIAVMEDCATAVGPLKMSEHILCRFED